MELADYNAVFIICVGQNKDDDCLFQERDSTSPLDGAECIAVESHATTQPDTRDVKETNPPTTPQPEPMDST